MKHQWLKEVVASYQPDPVAVDLLTRLVVTPDSLHPFSLSQGIIRHKNMLWLGSSKELQQRILTSFHSSPVGGHSGAPATYQHTKRLFYWLGMKIDVWSFVQSCSTCLQAKLERARYPRLLQPIPIPSSSWDVITMDFIKGLPHSVPQMPF